MTLHYYNDYESGLGGIGVETQSSKYGWGQNDPDSVVRIVQSPVFKGLHAVECLHLVSTGGGWRAANVKQEMTGLSEFYWGLAYYIPTGRFEVPSGGWVNMGQIQEIAGTTRLFCYLCATGNNEMSLLNNFAGGTHWLGGSWPIPRDRWFTVVQYLKIAAAGKVRMWLDGNMVVDYSQDFSSAIPGGNCAAGIYGGGGDSGGVLPANTHLFLDEFRVASTLAEATPVPSGTQHNLSVTSNPSGLPFTLRKTA